MDYLTQVKLINQIKQSNQFPEDMTHIGFIGSQVLFLKCDHKGHWQYSSSDFITWQDCITKPDTQVISIYPF